MKKMDELMTTLKLDELLNKRENDKKKNTLLWVLAIIGAVVAIAGIAYAVYRFVCPACPGTDEDFDDDFDDDFFDDDDFLDDEEKVTDEKDGEEE